MTEPAIAREAAEAMVKDWELELGATLEDDSRERIVRAVMAGRLDWSGSAFTYRLVSPIKLESGDVLKVLRLEEPQVGQIRDSAKGKRESVDMSIHLIASLTGQPLGVIERLKERDFTAVAEILGFFE